MGLLIANYNERLSFKIRHMPIWASIKAFEDTEKALIGINTRSKTQHQQAFIPDGTPE